MANAIERWRDLIGPRSLDEYLAQHFGDTSRYRISRRTYRPRENTAGAMIGGLCFVMRGRCRYSFKAAEFDLKDGDYCTLPRGNYSLTALGDDECATVTVFEIPLQELRGE